jgi:hypothetical protein
MSTALLVTAHLPSGTAAAGQLLPGPDRARIYSIPSLFALA